eukprot:SAG25_NODE_1086_length_4076_cov_1.856676_7_plen_152_part_00
MCEALRARLMFRRGYLNALHQLESKGAKALEQARRAVKFAQGQLRKISAISEQVQIASSADRLGFRADINRRLLGPAPPRALEPMSIEQVRTSGGGCCCCVFTAALFSFRMAACAVRQRGRETFDFYAWATRRAEACIDEWSRRLLLSLCR